MWKVKKSDSAPRCRAWTHPSMGAMVVCNKIAYMVMTNIPVYLFGAARKDYPVCRDHIGRTLINMGDYVDDIKMDIIVVVKD